MLNHPRFFRVVKISIRIALTLFLIQITSLTFLKPVEGTRQEPVNIGFIFSLPWDVSNTLRAPLAGPLSIILAGGLSLILFFGLMASPIWYLFGVPIRKYHLHEFDRPNLTAIISGDDGRSLRDFDMAGGPYTFLQGNQSNLWDYAGDINVNPNFSNRTDKKQDSTGGGYPDFMNSLFFFVPELQEDCKRLMVCHAHGFLTFLPDPIVQAYHFFSKKMLNVPECYKNAIVTGIMDQGNCMKTYQDCTQDIVTIAKSTLFYNIPENIRELWQLQNI